MQQNPWLITGATDGVGLALARWLVQSGQAVVLVGRKAHAELTDGLFSTERYCQADLAEPAAVEKIVAFLGERNLLQLRGIIHNAALGWVGDLADQTAENVRLLTEVNLIAPLRLSQALWQRTERIVFISSIVADFPSPRYAVYAATKGALDSLARSLRAEATGPLVQTLHLGAVRSGFHAKAGMTLTEAQRGKFPTPERAAQWIARRLSGSATEATMGLKNHAIRLLSRLLQAPFSRGLKLRLQTQTLTLPPASSLRHAVVTGSSQGIGAALATTLREQGWQVTGVDVQPSPSSLLADLSQPAQIAVLCDQLAKLPPIDLLIHNAGISATGAFDQVAEEKWLPVVRVNFLAPMLLTLALLQRQRLATGGSVVCISSLSHSSSYPGASVYAATKSGLAAYGSSLRAAFPARLLHVLTVFPGPVRTAHAREHSPDNSREHRRMDPAVLAQHILQAVTKKRARLIPGWGNQLSAWLGWCFPRLMAALMRKLLFQKMPAGRSILPELEP